MKTIKQNNMKKILTVLLISGSTLFFNNQATAQDIHFSQFYENAILRNPALVGIFSGDYKYGFNYRNQWSTISVPFQTGLVSGEMRIPVSQENGDFLSVGATLTYDHAGSINFNSTQIYPALNYNKSLEDKHHSYLSAGFAVGYIQRSVDPSKMKFSSQYSGGSYNPGSSSGENIKNVKLDYIDVGAGVSFNSSMGSQNNINYYIGAAAYHINKPKAAFNKNESFVRLNTKWNGNLGFYWSISPTVGLTAHGNYSKQGTYTETIIGGLLSWRKYDATMNSVFAIYGGVFYRFNDAMIPTIKLDYKKYSFTISYDYNTSSLRTASNGVGGVEISVYTRGSLTKGLWAMEKTKCPRFESMLMPTTTD